MKSKNKVSNREIAGEIKKAIVLNDNALDFIQNEIFTVENSLGYIPEDTLLNDRLKNLKYIKYILEFTTYSFYKSLKELGVNYDK